MNRLHLGIGLVLLIALLFITLGCQPAIHEEPTITGTGTVRQIDVPTVWYGIAGDDGNRYEPIDLPVAFREDGLRVAFAARIRDDMASIFMWGRIIEILSIELIGA